MHKWLLAGLLLGSPLLAAPLFAATDAPVRDNPPPRFVLLPGDRVHVAELTGYIELLEDASATLDIDAVSRPPFSAGFFPATPAAANVGFTHSAWWARFTLQNPSEQDRQVFLRQTYPLIDYLDLYEATDAGWQVHATGDRRKFATRAVAHRDFVFPLDIPAGGERSFYLRYQSQGSTDISLSLYGPTELVAALSREQLAYGVYFGCVVMLLVWSALVFVAVRDRDFLAYFAYVATFGLYMLVHNGLAFQFLWPASPRWGNTSLIALLNVALLAGLQFSRMILRAREYTPRLDRAARALQVLALAALAATPLLDYAVLIVPVTALILASVIFMLTLGVVSVLAGYRPARYYLIAWSSFLAGSVVFLLKMFGVLPHTFFTQNGWQIGSLLEMILLSLTLSSRMNELQHQSRTDPLTFLGNRRLFDDKLPAEFALAQQLHRPLSLLVLDIDHFKRYNDRHGHTQGDEAIKQVAGVLRKHARKPFIACRHGGEEFTVILPGADGEAAVLLAERLRRAVEEGSGGDLAITISIGLACTSQAGFARAEELFDAADAALYLAKKQGRNRVVPYRERRRDLPAEALVSRAANS